MRLIVPCLASFLLTSALTPLIIRGAQACNCVDAPGGRRLHKEPTPLWGGVAFFAGVLPFLLRENGNGTLTWYLVASLLLVGLGSVDDLRSLGWKVKFAGITASTTMAVFGGNLVVHHLGSYGWLGRVELGCLSIPFTYLCIIGITNAINLLDGLNGLAGGVALLGFLFMGSAAVLAGNFTVALMCLVFVGALSAFLIFNFPRARIFMGDSGSLFLGFSLACTAVLLTQGAGSLVNAMFPVLVLLIPIFDTLRVMWVRLQSGKNPFRADHNHLHYLFVENDVSPVRVSLLFWSLTALFGTIGLILGQKSSSLHICVALNLIVLLGLVARALTGARQARGAAVSASGAVSERPAPYDTSITAQNGEMMNHKWIVVIGIVLLAAQVSAGETLSLKTQQDKESYGLGVDMGKNLKRKGAEMDPDLVVKGMKDAMRGDKLLMTDQELLTTMRYFAAEQKTKKMKEAEGATPEQKLKADEEDILYAVGLALSKQLTSFDLSPAELEIVKQGLLHEDSTRKTEADLSAYNEKINGLVQSRRKAKGAKLAAGYGEFRDQAAREKGAIRTDSGLIYLSLREGSGAGPAPSDTVKISYRGALPDGKEFGSSYQKGEPIELKTDGAIKCWQEALQKMKPGGKARFVCPPELAYGDIGAGEFILPGATLVFEVELLEVKK